MANSLQKNIEGIKRWFTTLCHGRFTQKGDCIYYNDGVYRVVSVKFKTQPCSREGNRNQIKLIVKKAGQYHTYPMEEIRNHKHSVFHTDEKKIYSGYIREIRMKSLGYGSYSFALGAR